MQQNIYYRETMFFQKPQANNQQELRNHFLFPQNNSNQLPTQQLATMAAQQTNSQIPNTNINSHHQRRQSLPTQQSQPQQQQSYGRTQSKSVIEQSHSISKCGKPVVDFLIGGNKFTVDKKYKLLRAIGHGAYGFVCSAENTQTNEFVAIKKITNLFNNPIETKRAIREVQLLRKLRHENILGLIDLMMNDVKYKKHIFRQFPLFFYSFIINTKQK